MRRVLAIGLCVLLLTTGVWAHPVDRICTSALAISWWGLVESISGWDYFAWKYPGYKAGAYSISTCGRAG